MPAQDRIHNAVKHSLLRDNWTITAEPYTIEYEEVRVFADLRAERTDSAQEQEIVVIEIKSFLQPSFIHEFETALGQYQVYRALLNVVSPECTLYLALPASVHDDFFHQSAVRLLVETYNVSLLVVDTNLEVIVQWIN